MGKNRAKDRGCHFPWLARRSRRAPRHPALRSDPVPSWHGTDNLDAVLQAVILPGGFSYEDYLRCGAISRFRPVMTEVE